jgi:hypothetical protein
MDEQTVVIARYNEDIHWCLPFIGLVKVYNKGNDDLDYIPPEQIVKCENLGREGGTYIKHIIDNYDNLSKFTVFLQGNPFDHIDPTNTAIGYFTDEDKAYYKLLNTIEEEDKSYKFEYISGLLAYVSPEHVDDSVHCLIPLKSMFPAEYLKEEFKRRTYTYGAGALFVVHKDQILKHPKDFWIELYSHLQEVCPSAGYGLEKLWRLILE